MSTRNPKEWTKVGDTVRFWQDVLARIPDRVDYSVYNRGHHQFGNNNTPVVVHPSAPPQSFGELCLEIRQDTMRRVSSEYNVPPGFWNTSPDEMMALRRAMYHRKD